MHAATDTALCPLEWELLLPEECRHGDGRHRLVGIPQQDGYTSKTHLGPELLDRLAGQGLAVPMIVADAGYGRSVSFRLALEQTPLDLSHSRRSERDRTTCRRRAVPTLLWRAGPIYSAVVPRGALAAARSRRRSRRGPGGHPTARQQRHDDLARRRASGQALG